MAIATGAAIALGVAAAATAGSTAYAASQQPDAPDVVQQRVIGTVLEAKLLPYQNMIDAARKLGKKIEIKNPWNGKTETMDFTGLGDADISADYSQKMAAASLEMQQKYGPLFIEEARKQLQASDPEGFAAHQKLWSMIEADVNAPAEERPIATTLRDQVLEELKLGAELDPETQRQTEQAVRGAQIARGGGFGTADVAQEAMTTGQAAEARRTARQQKALSFLSSGTTPEDVAFREKQQKMANVGSFLSGTTPTSQFQQLSGAQNQAAPFYATQGTNMNPNAGQQQVQNSSQNYSIQSQQPNPWLQGAGLLMQSTAMGINAYQTNRKTA